MRVGIGYDVHPLVPGRPLVLGGVTVPYPQGLQGHSDGDALTHALVDALLGAAALGDIGQHFPSSDPRYRGISSLRLLDETRGLLEARRWRVTGVDATIVAERPLLSPFIPTMRQRLAETLQLPLDRVSVKATTTNGLGFIGRGEGIAAQAVATLEELGDEGL